MVDLVLIIGPPASGKTTYIAQNYQNHIVADDFSLSKNIPRLLASLLIWSEICQLPIIMSDPWLCKPSFMKNMSQYLSAYTCLSVNKIYFKGRVETLQKNLELRAQKDKRRISNGTLKFFSAGYSIPEDAMIVPYYGESFE